MIFIAIVIMAVVIVALAFYFRAGIANLAQGLVADAQATWLDFRTLVWPAIRATVLVGFLVSLIPWAIFLLIMRNIGSDANSIKCATVIGFLLPFWFFIFIMPKCVRKIRAINVVGHVLSVILVVAALPLLFGVFFPETKGSLNRLHDSGDKSIAYSVNDRSASSEAETGVIRAMSEDSCVYNVANGGMMFGKDGNPWKVFRGKKVKIMDPNGKPIFINGSEGMVRVMLMNKGDDFKDGYVVYVPNRKINRNG